MLGSTAIFSYVNTVGEYFQPSFVLLRWRLSQWNLHITLHYTIFKFWV